jgi:hypothetical protein
MFQQSSSGGISVKAKLIAATAALLVTTGTAHAAIVTFSTPISVTNNFDGRYINLLTGASGTSGGTVTGWDINPYNSGTGLSFFWSAAPSQASGVASTTSGPYLDLAPGAVVSSASTFAQVTATAAANAFKPVGNHTLGFRFYNETTSAINYGYMTLASGGSNGFPLTISGWSFDNTGAGITVPGAGSAVPETATWAMMILGVGAIGSALRRRRNVAVKLSYAA